MPTFTNKATLSYNGRSVESNTVTGNLTETLAITKLALSDTYGDGERLTYVISLINSGSLPLSGITLSDDLGGFELEGETVYPLSFVDGSVLYLANGAPMADPELTNGQPLTLSGISVPARGNATVIYQADVTDFAPLDQSGEITNTVTATGAGLPEPLTADATVTTRAEPNLTITKALDPTTVPENGALTYTFVISNSGNTAAIATDSVVVTDIFDPVLDISAVTLDGAPLTLGTGYTYSAATGLFETAAGVITVPAATYAQNDDGSFTVIPGTATLTVSGTV